MFRSIRWRLVLSFVGVTLLTVGSTGVLALSLLEQSLAQQEIEHLTANADAVGRQLLGLVGAPEHHPQLESLVRTSAFLADARIRVLDGSQRVVVDSGSRREGGRYMWVLPSQLWWSDTPGDPLHPVFIALDSEAVTRVRIELEDRLRGLLGELPPDAELTYVRTNDALWGSRITFEDAYRPEEPVPDTTELRSEAPRSDQKIVVPIGRDDDPQGYVEISDGPSFAAEAISTARRAFQLAAAGAMVVAVLCGLLVSQSLAAPVRELTEAAGQMSSGDLSIRAQMRSKDEIGQLAQQFNRMAERLEASFGEVQAERDTLRRFIADASHELRTPITALKSFNDLLRGAAADDPQAQAEFLAESQIQLERLEWITGNLLDLSRLDAGLVSLEMEEHDVAVILQSVVAAFRTRAAEKGISLSILHPVGSLAVTCDRVRIEMALCNLVENSVKYLSAGGEVELGSEQEGELVRLWVRDTGPGIDPDDQPHVFERFYRGRNGQAEGTGLGLAIVRGIVEAHGGRTWVESEPDAGSRVVIELPQ